MISLIFNEVSINYHENIKFSITFFQTLSHSTLLSIAPKKFVEIFKNLNKQDNRSSVGFVWPAIFFFFWYLLKKKKKYDG